jgi:hypothetical protein
MVCQECHGTRVVEVSVPVGPRFAPTPNDWATAMVSCPECKGTGVEHVACFRCPERVPVEMAVEGATIDNMFSSWWFCPTCAAEMGK